MAGGAQRFRWPVLIVASLSLFLSGASIFFIFSAFNQRSDDFTLVSAGPVTSSCVSYVTDTQLKLSKYDQTTWSCGDNSKKELANLLSASVHAAYALGSAAFTDEDAKTAYDTVISLAQGGTGHELQRKHAYAMLSLLAVTDPTKLTCEQVYPGATFKTIEPNQIHATVVCDDVTPAEAGSGNSLAALTDADADLLYTHCVDQFTYAFSGPAAGTFQIPLQGTELKPTLLPIFETNSTTSKFKKAQVLVGTRWGFASIVYILMALCSAFLLMDCIVLLLAELTRVDAYFAQNALTEGGNRTMKEGMMTMLATFQAKRDFRFTIALLLIILEVVLWVLLIGLPWGFGVTFGRPICQGADRSYWLFGPVWAEAAGGWKSDWAPSLIEYIVMISHFFVLVAIPISTLFKRSGGNVGQREREGAGSGDGWTGVAVKSLRSSWWFTALAIGGLVIFIGQAIADFRFGIAWAASITKNSFSTPAVGTALYDQINALLFLTLTVGFSLASIIGRWLLAGLSCTSFTIFLLWCGLALGAFVPLFFVSGFWIFFSVDGGSGAESCDAIFGTTDGEYAFAKTACTIRTWTYIVGIIFVIISVLGPMILGLIDYTRVLLLPRRRAWIEMPDYWARLVDPLNPKFRSVGASMNSANINLGTGAGYRGTKPGGFFDFKTTSLTVPADQVHV